MRGPEALETGKEGPTGALVFAGVETCAHYSVNDFFVIRDWYHCALRLALARVVHSYGVKLCGQPQFSCFTGRYFRHKKVMKAGPTSRKKNVANSSARG